MLDAIARALEVPASALALNTVGGGCVSDTAVVSAGKRRAFLKREPAERAWQLQAEAEGLEALAAAGALRVPRPLSCGARCWSATTGCSRPVMRWPPGACHRPTSALPTHQVTARRTVRP